MTKQKSGHLVHSSQRRERGTAVPLSFTRVKLKDGSSGQVVGLDLSQAEVPDKSYFGEACGTDYVGDSVRIMFAQPKLSGGELRSLVLISMPPPSAKQFAQSIERMKNPTIQEIIASVHVPPKQLMAIPLTEPDQTASLTANLVAVGVHGHESCLDFYHANAFAHLAAQSNSSQMFLEPVVRVNTHTGLLYSLLVRLNELSAQFPKAELVEEVSDE